MSRKDIDKEYLEKFINDNSEHFELKSSQDGISVPIINRMYKKMKADLKFSGIKVDISESLIVNGHHRYISSKLCEYEIEIIPYTRSPTSRVIEWSDMNLDDEDWDTELDLQTKNKEDCEFNDIPIVEIERILK